MRCLTLSLCLSFALAGCATARTVPVPPAAEFKPAVRLPDKPPLVVQRALETAAVPTGVILTLPAPAPASSSSAAVVALKPLDRVAAANKAAVQEPRSDAFISAIQVYPYLEGALYRLYAAPDRVTDIALQSGENLVAISSGDTSRWIIGNTHSGSEGDVKAHILVKPQLAGLKTNLVIATDRRTYHLQMESTPATAMAALSWRYPQDELLAMQAAAKKAEAVAPTAEGVALDRVYFGYTISGATPAWRPLRAFDDGARVYIQFPASLKTTEAPPLFIVGKGGQAQLVNYRISRDYYIVDGVFDIAELRLGEKPQTVVRITSGRASGGRHD